MAATVVSAPMRLVLAASTTCLIGLAITIANVPGAAAQTTNQYYAAPSGSPSGDGTIDNPWDLATALNSNARGVKGGDTIWLRGGWYVGTYTSSLTGDASAPIVVRQYPGERATIDRSGGAPYIDALYVTGSYAWYWGFEITDTDPRRTTLDTGSFPADLPRWNGVYTTAPNNKFINLVVHDLANGLAVYGADSTEVYGSLVYFNGWDAPDRGHGHGIYTQNLTGIRAITDNVIFGQLSHGIHAYGSGDASLNNIQLVGNTSFDNGILTQLNPYYDRNFLLGGGVVAVNPVVTDNYTYYSPGDIHSGGDNNIGYNAGCTNLRATRNYFGNVINSPLTLVNCSGDISNNTFVGPLDSNVLAFTQNTFITNRPSGTRVFVRPNRYESGRANVTIFNWDNAAAVGVDLSGTGLRVGDQFQIKDAENFFDSPVVSGTYSGGLVSIPMMNLTAVSPIGVGVTIPGHTRPEFGAFIVMPGTTGTLAQFTQPPARPLPYGLSMAYLGTTRDAVGRGSVALASDGSLDGAFQIAMSALPGPKTVSKLELKLANNGGSWNTFNNTWWVAGVAATPSGALLNASDASIHLSVGSTSNLYVFASDTSGSSLFTPGSLWFVNVYFTDGTMAVGHTSIDHAVVPPPPPPLSGGGTATFVRTDAATQGSWRGVYGSEGYAIANDSASLPANVQVAFAQQLAWTWSASTPIVRALQKGGNSNDRLASCWYSNGSFTIDIALTDSAVHELAIYSLDWDNQARAQTIEVDDAATGTMLDRRSVTGFFGGQYFVWHVSGHVVVRVTKTGPNSSAVSGLFFAPVTSGSPPPPPLNVAPVVQLTSPATGATFVAPATIPLSATATDSDGTVTAVTFATTANGIGPGVAAGSTYTFSWTNVAVGTYHVTAAATDNAGATTVSPAVDISVVAPPPPPPPPNVAPTVQMTTPGTGATFVAPATIPLTATASDSDGAVTSVTFATAGGTIGAGVAAGSSYAFSWSNVAIGTYHVTASATDNRGATTISTPLDLSVVAPAPPAPPPPTGVATAVFVQADATTQGTWQGVYGAEGYALANESARYPSYAQVTLVNQQAWTWAASTTSVQALQKSAGPDRIAACWYTGASLNLDVNLTDGVVHQVAVYALDWDAVGRSETIDVLDATTGALLDSRTVTGFAQGQYRVWRVGGHVTIRITRTGGNSATVSGIFFDAATPSQPAPNVALTTPATATTLTTPASITLSAGATVTGATVNMVSFYAGTTLIGTSANTSSPFTLPWSNMAVGTYVVTAKAFASSGTTATSAPVTVTVRSSGGSAGTGASFVGTDTTTLGSWRGVYGADGYGLANDSAMYPGYVQVAVSGQSSWTWAASASDLRALQRGGTAVDRIAACWYTGSTFSVDLTVTDGAVHQIAFYSLDWDGVGRTQSFEVRDAVTGVLLDTQTVAGFQSGRYSVWRISGHVTIRGTRTGGNSAVLSGVFFDPAP